MRILKVANVANSRNSGMGRVMHNSADELRNQGHRVDFLFAEDVPRPDLGRFDRLVFPVALVRTVRQRLRRGAGYDVVEIHEPSAAWYCAVRQYDRTLPPCVVMCHGVEGNFWRHRLALDRVLGRPTSLKSRVVVPLTLLSQAKYALQHCQQIMCLNRLDEKFLREVYHVPETRITRIQSGVEEHFFSGPNREAQPSPRLLFVGTWLDNKGGRFLIEAFEQLHREDPDLQLSLLGTGLTPEQVLTAMPPHLHAAVTVRSQVDDDELIRAYADHDILVLPSYFESWGLVLLEAAAAGLAIVATRTGGACDILTDEHNALLVPLADARALEAALRRLLQDPQLRHALGCRARCRARELSWRAAADTYGRAYERALHCTL